MDVMKTVKNAKANVIKRKLPGAFSTVTSSNNKCLNSHNSDFSYSICRSFAKKGKKALEKEQKQDKKAQAEPIASKEIDFNPLEEELQVEIDGFGEYLTKMKFGRLTPEHFEGIPVQAYGEMCPMTDLCQIITKNATTVGLNIFDTDQVENIRRALQTSSYDFDIRKDNDSMMIVSLSNPNSKEVKLQFLKEIKLRSETCKKNLRNIRGHHINEYQKFKDAFGKDIVFEAEKEAQNIYEKALKEMENMHKSKETQINSM